MISWFEYCVLCGAFLCIEVFIRLLYARNLTRHNSLRETALRTRCASRPCAAAQRTGRVLRVVLVVPSMLYSHSPASVPSVFRVATTPWSSVAAASRRERCRRHELRQALVLVQARSHFLPARTCT